jgi:hypothetical protein
VTFSVIKDVVLFLLAIYGAALSTFNWRQAVGRERRRILVKATTAMPTYGSQLGPAFACLEAINIGHRVVTVATLVFELADTKERIYPMESNTFPGLPDTQLPVALSDGQSAKVYLAHRQLADALLSHGRGTTKLVPVCVDSVGGVYRGEPWEVDPAQFSRM